LLFKESYDEDNDLDDEMSRDLTVLANDSSPVNLENRHDAHPNQDKSSMIIMSRTRQDSQESSTSSSSCESQGSLTRKIARELVAPNPEPGSTTTTREGRKKAVNDEDGVRDTTFPCTSSSESCERRVVEDAKSNSDSLAVKRRESSSNSHTKGINQLMDMREDTSENCGDKSESVMQTITDSSDACLRTNINLLINRSPAEVKVESGGGTAGPPPGKHLSFHTPSLLLPHENISPKQEVTRVSDIMINLHFVDDSVDEDQQDEQNISYDKSHPTVTVTQAASSNTITTIMSRNPESIFARNLLKQEDNSFYDMKRNLERDISVLKDQLGMFCTKYNSFTPLSPLPSCYIGSLFPNQVLDLNKTDAKIFLKTREEWKSKTSINDIKQLIFDIKSGGEDLKKGINGNNFYHEKQKLEGEISLLKNQLGMICKNLNSQT